MEDKLKIAQHYKTILQAEGFVLTGSTALNLLGFGNNSDDLDLILINPLPHTFGILESLEKENPIPNKIDYPGPVENRGIFQFTHNGIKIDVFICGSDQLSPISTNSGMMVAQLKSIVKAKLSYNRPKDYVQLLKLRNSILSDDQFKTYINSL
jgi:hypothetical protein